MAKYKIIPSSRTIVQSPISIGHKAEKGVEAIEFDLTAWVETYGSGTLTVIMRRWGDAIPYPIALEIDENNKATWTLSDTDTAKAGMAYAQLSYIVGDTVVKKSDIYTFRVMDSLVGEGDPPEAYESWLENLTHLAAEAMAEVLDIEGIVTDKTLSIEGGIADAKATGDALSALEDQFTEETDKIKADLDELLIPLKLVATYQGKQARATGLNDSPTNTVYQFEIPDNCETVHITSYFFGNSRIIFTNSATPIDFTTGQYKGYPSTGYNNPTDIDDDYATLHFKYVYVTFLVTEGRECKVSCSALDIINFIGSNTPIAENTSGNITDFNDAKRNHIYVITSGISSISNYPPIPNGGTLLCFAAFNMDNVQIFISNQSAIFFRRMWERGSWGAWTQIPSLDLVENTINTAIELIESTNEEIADMKTDISTIYSDIDELNGVIKYPTSLNMEFGQISLYGYNDLRYTSSTKRVRTLQGGNIHMKQGYKITLSDYTTHRYFLFQIVSSERVNALGWKQEDFEITDEADYAILISALPEATVTDVAELASLMTIYTTKDEEDESGIPSYWDNEMNTSIATIQSNELEAGNRIFEFVFLTDTHWAHNAKNSPAIVEFLSDTLHINQIFGGDVITSHYENKASAISEIREFYNAFTKPLPTVLGNHDFNAANDTTQRFSMAECYALMIRQQENVLGMDTFASPYYWTLDNVSQKVRMIGFRCDGINAVSSDIIAKVNTLISELSAEWNVILLTHGFWAVTAVGEPIAIATPVQAVIDAIMPTIESANASVPLWVVGHSHRDQSQVITGTNKSILVLGCNCDAYAESAVWGGETMTQGTATEQAITCIQLDMTNKKVHAVRIGAGSDRTFSY